MSTSLIVDVILSGKLEDWTERNKAAFSAVFGASEGRYPKAAESEFTLRAPAMTAENGVPFAAYIHPSNPRSGPYSGLSFVIFPVAGEPCLIGLVVGTQGLTPDETILGRPGHARKVQAITSWLNRRHGQGQRVAWAKQDPTRTDIEFPDDLRQQWSTYKSVFDRYGREVYGLFRPTADREATQQAVDAFMDLLFGERGYQPVAREQKSAEEIRREWFEHLMPSIDRVHVRNLLKVRKYVILQGPPGTGKTRMGTELIKDEYSGSGKTIQFHPGTSYESFVGGLAPVHSTETLGLRFEPAPGFLMRAAEQALGPREYLLHIDEINRADLGKILGEAISLLEPTDSREVELPYDFGPPFGSKLRLPKNLHILGTMNTSDRSIGLIDVAIRRRFAFVPLWPDFKVVREMGCDLMQQAFQNLISIFVEHASTDSFSLIPGHSYFLESERSKAVQSLQVNLAPLLEEYLTQGYVSGFSEPIRSYLQWLWSL